MYKLFYDYFIQLTAEDRLKFLVTLHTCTIKPPAATPKLT